MVQAKIKIIALALAVIVSGLGFVRISHAATLDVPYSSQAPLGQWSDPRQEDGCEEASIVMAMMWVNGSQLTPEEERTEIVGMSDYEKFFHGFFQDTSAQDTANLMVQYYGYKQIGVEHNVTVNDVKAAIDEGFLVIVPLNPRVISTQLYNKYATRHTVVVSGYDSQTGDIIFQDPMVGPNRRTNSATFNRAMQDYPSGVHINTTNRPSSMIIVAKP